MLAAVACDVQARRWRAPLLDAAAIIAVGLILTGVAALVPVPVGLLAAAAAGVLLAARRDAAAATLALASASSPILVALAESRIGPGTLDRIGAVGDVARVERPALRVPRRRACSRSWRPGATPYRSPPPRSPPPSSASSPDLRPATSTLRCGRACLGSP